MNRTDSINQEQLAKLLSFEDTNALVQWVLNLPKSYNLRIDGGLVVFQNTEKEHEEKYPKEETMEDLDESQLAKITTEEVDKVKEFLGNLKPNIQLTMSQLEKSLAIPSIKLEKIIEYLLSKDPDYGEYHIEIETFVKKEAKISLSEDDFSKFLKEMELKKEQRKK